MPLDELLALYGYESSDPISEQESEGGDAAPTLPDMTLDKVSGSLPVRAPGRRLAAPSGRRAGGMPGPGYGSYSVIKCDGCSPAPSRPHWYNHVTLPWGWADSHSGPR